MPPRLSTATLRRSIAFRPRPQVQCPARPSMRWTPSPFRPYSDSNQVPAADRSKREDAKPMEPVSEEAAAVAKTMGEPGPDLNQGTPIEHVRYHVPGRNKVPTNSSPGRSRRQGGAGQTSQGHARQTRGAGVRIGAQGLAILFNHDNPTGWERRHGQGTCGCGGCFPSARDAGLEVWNADAPTCHGQPCQAPLRSGGGTSHQSADAPWQEECCATGPSTRSSDLICRADTACRLWPTSSST